MCLSAGVHDIKRRLMSPDPAISSIDPSVHLWSITDVHDLFIYLVFCT